MLKELEEAIDKIDDSSKSVYMEAREKVPHLVETESDPMMFLRARNFDIVAAAKAIVGYWEFRKHFFEDRAFLPMDLTGKGTMSEDDIEVLKTGFARILPCDSEGRPVVLFDKFLSKKRSLHPHRNDCNRRCICYLLHILSQRIEAQTTGVVLMRRIRVNFGVKIAEFLKQIQQASAVRVHHMHLLLTPPEPSATRTFDRLFKPAMMKAIGEMGEDLVTFHLMEKWVAGSVESFCRRTGLQKEHLPGDVGGLLEVLPSDPTPWLQDVPKVLVLTKDEDTEMPRGNKRQKLGNDPGQTEVKVTEDAEKDKIIRSIDSELAQLEPAAKTAYLDAMKNCPDLVQKESDPLLFYRRCRSDAKQAAWHLASCWRTRTKLLGSRSMLPMSQTGEGSLCRKYVTFLTSGTFCTLPNDDKGRSVFFLDGNKIGKVSKDSLLNVAFYLLSLVRENPTSIEQGFVFIVLLQDCGRSVLDRITFADILDAIPSRLAEVHVLCDSKSESRAITRAQKLFGRETGDDLRMHVRKADNDWVQKLQKYGLSKDSLHKSIPGGGWGVQRFVEWCELRTRYEWDLPPGTCHKEVDKIFDFSEMKLPSQLSEEERVERARRMNVLHSRRKRERERIEIEVLHEQVSDLRTENSILSEEQVRLERIVDEAERHVERQASVPLSRMAELSSYASNLADPFLQQTLVSDRLSLSQQSLPLNPPHRDITALSSLMSTGIVPSPYFRTSAMLQDLALARSIQALRERQGLQQLQLQQQLAAERLLRPDSLSSGVNLFARQRVPSSSGGDDVSRRGGAPHLPGTFPGASL